MLCHTYFSVNHHLQEQEVDFLPARTWAIRRGHELRACNFMLFPTLITSPNTLFKSGDIFRLASISLRMTQVCKLAVRSNLFGMASETS